MVAARISAHVQRHVKGHDIAGGRVPIAVTRPFQGTVGIEGQLAHGSPPIERLTIQRAMHIPAVVASLAEVHRHHVLTTQRVEHAHRRAAVIGLGIGQREGVGRRRGTCIHVHAYRSRRGLLRSDVRRIQLQILGSTVGHHPILVHRIARQALARGVDDVTALVQLELPFPGIGDGAAVVRHAEETATVDAQVQRVVGGGQRTLRELLSNCTHFGTDARRDVGNPVHRGGVHISEFGTRCLEANGTGVGNVVADRVQMARRCIQAGKPLLKCHGSDSSKNGDPLKCRAPGRVPRTNDRKEAIRSACVMHCPPGPIQGPESAHDAYGRYRNHERLDQMINRASAGDTGFAWSSSSMAPVLV